MTSNFNTGALSLVKNKVYKQTLFFWHKKKYISPFLTKALLYLYLP